jgi:hypothetical protein
MLEIADYLLLVKAQNRTLATMRHMMERGYFILFLPDKTDFGKALPCGQWALCKHPTPRDENGGVALFEHYDSAYEAAQRLVWVEHDFQKVCGTIHPLSSLTSLSRVLSPAQVRELL